MLLLCGCGGRLMTEARALPDVRILDETPPLSEAPSPAPLRAAASVPSPSNAAKPSPTPSPEPTPNPALCPYVGSKNSEIYHLAGCSQAARIKTENLLGWESMEAAEAAGRTACKACLSGKPEKTPKPASTPAPTETVIIPIASPEPTAEQQPGERAIPGAYAYVGSKNSEIYHLAGCSQAERIKAENLLGWESMEAAEASGRTPCKVCLPEQEAIPEPTKTPQPEETVIPIATAEPQPEERMTSGEYAYVGSKKSNKYHLPSCRYAQSIDEENRIGWATREAAEAAGYEACKSCKP